LAIEKGDRSSKPYMVMAESLFKMGELSKGFEAVQRGININPEYPDLHNLLGLFYLQQKKCRAAIDCFKRAIGLNLYYGEPYLNLAKAYLLNSVVKEDYELSKNLEENFLLNLEKAFQLNPFLDAETLDRAKKQFDDRQYEESFDTLQNVKAGESRTGIEDIVLELYLDLLQNGGDIKEVDIDTYIERIGEIIDRNPSFADGFNSLGILYAAKCKIFLDRSRNVFIKALEINKNYKKAQKNLRLTENERQGIFILLKALLD
jgi:tetratricopeptide (TPR) repeat protein